MSKEIWKSVKGFECYYSVSNTGRVKSLKRVVSHDEGKGQRVIKERIITNWMSNGYHNVSFSVDGKVSKHKVHRLVAMAFIDNPENKYTVNHIDGNKTNNKVNNLEWATLSENNKHAYNTGLFTTFGENQPTSILKYDEVKKIRELYKTGDYFHRELAVMFGVGRRHIGDIINNKRWANMDKDKCIRDEAI